MDFLANKIFILDIFIHFMASYQDSSIGAEVFQPKAIAIHYLKNEFAFDFISTIPLRDIGVHWFGITS